MKENVGCCCGVLQTCCHRPDPKKDIIKGIFEINHSPWFSLCAAGRSVAIRIYSSHKVDQSTGKGSESDNAYLIQGKVLEREKLPIMEGKMKLPTRIIKFELKFEVERGFGTPGAFVIENRDKHEFFLKSATLKYSIPDIDKREFRFYCGSWVYPLQKTGVRRFFFTNQLYLPSKTPSGLKELRQKELKKLRGGSKDERKPWDRVYEYDYYNDLGDPDNGRKYARPVLGGSDHPYPRRLKTGRPPCKNDLSAESRPASCFQIYVPPDERLSQEKQEELTNNFVDALQRFLSPKTDHPNRWYQGSPDLIKKIVHFFVPRDAFSTGDFRILQSIVDFFRRKPKSSSHQDTDSLEPFDVILDIFSEKEVKEIDGWVKQKLEKLVPKEIFNEVVATSTKRNLLNSQLPSIIAEDKFAWVKGKEFGRQMLAGTNPVRIRRLLSSPKDKELSPDLSGTNRLPEEVLKNSHVKEAMEKKRAYILEHYHYLLPFLNMINGKGVCAYATRTILAAGDALKPIAIELRLPDPNGSMVVFPHHTFEWELAKFHVAANDAAYHQLVSHWLHTHAVIEPFIIATRRQLSVMHPIHRLLDPHFKDTLHINAIARGVFLNAGGILEKTLFTGEFSMQLSSHLYKQWRFEDQALPKDLEKRGMAVQSFRDKNVSGIKEKPAEKKPEKIDDTQVERDESLEEIDENVVELDENPATDEAADEEVKFRTGVTLILEDYPYAKDGIEIWHAIETWVREYCKIFYDENDDAIKEDEEIKEWWTEIRAVGHGDQKEGWYDLKTSENLVKALTTLIWITSGMHAAVNFGQYAYAGWPPNRPMLLRKFIPKEGTKEYVELTHNPDKFIVEMLPEKFQMSFVIAVMDLLSRHTSDEVYLGQRPPKNEWEEKEEVTKKFQEFREKLQQIERNIMERNKRYNLMNRWGYAKIPYKLLYPDTSKTRAPSKEKSGPEKMDITGMGIPNSISI
ncbi:probable linoleate 9S-lipoxygenase 4 [Durio zibethinus]|uniref:Lipoxygenase n=1 Tax=Durio zibethinus TaxID=66656 RepID=A0A6P6B2Z2_DURZI|nr:probable linoleate 9S-lipoxygenase 4 [Durio zibethinus]